MHRVGAVRDGEALFAVPAGECDDRCIRFPSGGHVVENAQYLFERHPFAVGAVLHQGLEYVGNRDDSGFDAQIPFAGV